MLSAKIYFAKNSICLGTTVGSTFLGLMHDVFPLALSDITDRKLSRNNYLSLDSINVYSDSPLNYPDCQMEKIVDDSVLANNTVIANKQSCFALVPSDGTIGRNGTFPDSQSNFNLRSNLTRYFQGRLESMISEHVVKIDDITADEVQSRFSSVRNSIMRPKSTVSRLDYLVGFNEAMVAADCHVPNSLSSTTKNIIYVSEIMLRLENIGYRSTDYIKGLKIELLDFQRQSVQWAYEREIAPGGILNYFWSKLSDHSGKDVYFNPLVGFEWVKPKIVRGGYIAEEMGLGKTVISLALILKNPAPVFPPSGSPVSMLEEEDHSNSSSDSEYEATWDEDVCMNAVTNNNKRGSILSQGTLVIVSLWLKIYHSSNN